MIRFVYDFPKNAKTNSFHSNKNIKFVIEDVNTLLDIPAQEIEKLTKEQMFILGATIARGYCKIENA